jgi:PAS domain S-box-containing protein
MAIDNFENKFLETILNSKTFGIVYLDKNRKAIKANRRVLEIFGIKIKDFTGRSVKDIHINDEHYKEFDKYYLALKDKEVVVEYPFKHQNGSTIWCKLVGKSINNSDLSEGAIWIIEDITKEKHLEIITSKTDIFKPFKTQNPLAYQSLNLNTEILYVNDTWKKVFGYNFAQIKGKKFIDFIQSSSVYSFKNAFQTLLTNGYLHSQNLNIISSKGEILHILFEALVEYNDSGDFLQANCILKNITDEVNAEKKLQESEKKYKLLTDNISDVIWTMDLEGNFTYVSPSVIHLRGYTPEEVMQQSINNSLAPNHASYIMKFLKEGIKNETNGIPIKSKMEFEVQQIHKDGHYIWTEVVASPIRNENGLLVEIVGATRDLENRKKHENMLKEQEKTLSSIFKATPIGIGLTINRNISKVNKAFCELLGYAEEELIGKNTRMIYTTTKEYKRVGKLKEKDIREKGYSVFNCNLISKKGQELNAIISNAPIDINDSSKGMVFTCIDITEMTQTQIALKESQRQIKTLLDNLQGMAYRCKNDEYWTMQFISDAVENITGFKASDIIENKNISYSNIIHPADRDYVKKSIDNAIKKEGHFTLEYRIITKRDNIKWVWEQGIGVKDMEGNLIFIEGYINDITDRKLALESLEKTSLELKRSLRFTEILLNSVPIPVFYKNKDGKYIGCNQAYLNHLGLKKEELIGKTALDLWPGELGEKYHKKDMELLANPQSAQTYEFKVKTIKGEIRNVIFAKSVFYDEFNMVTGILGAFQDITDIKNAQIMLEKSKIKAEESDRLKTAFLQNMSHEIRTPMNGIIGFSNLLKNPDLDNSTQTKYINIINQSSNQLLNIVNDILDISRIETNQVKIHITSFDLHKTLEYLFNLHKPQINKDISFSIEFPDNKKELMVDSDEEKIIQITNNLLTNATKFTTKGFIKLGYKLVNQNLIIYVQDTGIGIDKTMHDIIFDRFRRLENDNTLLTSGTGLGLSISKGLAIILGGKINLDSKPEKGSTFSLEIPYIYNTVIENVSKKSIENLSITRTGKILIAEDDDVNYYYIKTLLKKKKVEILRARNGREAVDKCLAIPEIALVLMDIKMPQLDGFEATKLIKQRRKDIIIIAQTAYAMEADKINAIKNGCNDYISKPVEAEELYKIIETYLSIK